MIRAMFRFSLPVVLLLPWLAGCAVFSSDGAIPPEPQTVGVAAQNMALRQQLREGHGGQPDVFVPLTKAQAAVEAARAQPQINTYAAGMLAQARAELNKAEQLWTTGDQNRRDNPALLARIANHAHDAQRLAQIARFTALREIKLARLDETSAQLRRLRAEADSATSGTDGRLVGTKVVPGRFGSFHFKPGTAELTASSRPVVAKLAALLKSNPDVGVAILGHTNNSEPSEQTLARFMGINTELEQQGLSHQQQVYAYNLVLSRERARMVARALVQAGVSARRIGARGFGSSRPVASNSTAEGRAANQRVVAVIIPGPDSKGSPLRKPTE